MDMSVDSIFEALSALEDDPKKIWDLIEKHYAPSFFEGVIVKRYSSMFASKDEEEFNKQMDEIRRAVLEEIISLSK
jgi:hypothetical protein